MQKLPPQRRAFKDQHSDEEVVLFLRRHWSILLSSMSRPIVLALVAVIAYFVVPYFLPDLVDVEILPLVNLILYVYILFVVAYAFHIWLDYYLDVWIVTTERILNIEQDGLFNRTASEQKIYRVQDVTSVVKGVMATLFDYGDVHIQTAGTEKRFVFEQVEHPGAIKKAIIATQDMYLKDNDVAEDKVVSKNVDEPRKPSEENPPK